MKEPLLFNTLDEAGTWLTEETGSSWSARQVLNAVITTHDTQRGTKMTTVLQAAPPLGTEFGLYELDVEAKTSRGPFSLKQKLGWVLIPVDLNSAKLMLACGEADITFLSMPESRGEEGVYTPPVCTMPLGESVRINLSMLGLGGGALKDLAARLAIPAAVPRNSQFNIGASPRLLPPPVVAEIEIPSARTEVETGPQAGGATWVLNKPLRVKDPLAWMIYIALKAAHVAGRPRPDAREVYDYIDTQRPAGFVEINGDEIKFLDADGNVDTKGIVEVRRRITRATATRAP